MRKGIGEESSGALVVYPILDPPAGIRTSCRVSLISQIWIFVPPMYSSISLNKWSSPLFVLLFFSERAPARIIPAAERGLIRPVDRSPFLNILSEIKSGIRMILWLP